MQIQDKIHGYARKVAVPDIPGTAAKVCGKCDLWFAAASRQRVCTGCIPSHKRTLRALSELGKCNFEKEGVPQYHPAFNEGVNPQVTDAPEAPRAFTYEDLCQLWARRTAKLMKWLENTGRPLREYRDYGKLTAREVSVAIGWVPWPASWPGRLDDRLQARAT